VAVITASYSERMRAVAYLQTGDSGVLSVIDKALRDPGPGEVRVRVYRSGVNPADWKSRQGSAKVTQFNEPQVPGKDGAGIVDAVGAGVDAALVGQRVWIWEASYQRADGTSQEYTIVPVRQVVPLPDSASFDLGAALGIPFLTAHRCLTLHEEGPVHLGPGSLDGRFVLVAGGAGAVGNAAIQLAKWAEATVITTVSSPAKAQLAAAAGANHVVDYRTQDAVAEIRRITPRGVDIIVEVAPAANAGLNAAVAAQDASIGVYANDKGSELTLQVGDYLARNIRWQFVLVYTTPHQAKVRAIADVSAAVAAGEVRVGPEAGLPLHHFALEDTAAAHEAVRAGAIGKVLIDVTD
jgi:NADPH2:quinone reductase